MVVARMDISERGLFIETIRGENLASAGANHEFTWRGLDPWARCVVVELYPPEMMETCAFIAGMISENS